MRSRTLLHLVYSIRPWGAGGAGGGFGGGAHSDGGMYFFWGGVANDIAQEEAQPCASTTSRSTTACCEDWSKGYRGNNAPDHVNVFMRKKDSTNVVTIHCFHAAFCTRSQQMPAIQTYCTIALESCPCGCVAGATCAWLLRARARARACSGLHAVSSGVCGGGN